MTAISSRLKIFTNTDLRLAKESSIGLDLIRGVSAQMVLVGHALSYYRIYPSEGNQSPFSIQNLGVLVFFILSGFLITLTTRKKAIENPSYGFTGFFFDRFVRIFSAYLPAILFVLIIDKISIGLNPGRYDYLNAFDTKTFIGNIFMLQDFPDLSSYFAGINDYIPDIFKITSFGSARPFWTIAIEWWFYMFFGWVFFFKKIKLNLALKILVLFFFLIIPLYNLRGGRANCLTYLWYAGFFLSYIYNSRLMLQLKKAVIGILLVLLGCLFYFFIKRFDLKVYNYQIGGIVAGGILLLIVLFPKTPGFFSNQTFRKYIKLVADFSFALYLIHYTILSFLHETLQFYTDKPWIGFWGSVLICNIIAFVFAYFTEFHHKQLRAYIFKKYKV